MSGFNADKALHEDDDEIPDEVPAPPEQIPRWWFEQEDDDGDHPDAA